MTDADKRTPPRAAGASQGSRRLGWSLIASLVLNLALWRLVSAIAGGRATQDMAPVEITRVTLSARGQIRSRVVTPRRIAERRASLRAQLQRAAIQRARPSRRSDVAPQRAPQRAPRSRTRLANGRRVTSSARDSHLLTSSQPASQARPNFETRDGNAAAGQPTAPQSPASGSPASGSPASGSPASGSKPAANAKSSGSTENGSTNHGTQSSGSANGGTQSSGSASGGTQSSGTQSGAPGPPAPAPTATPLPTPTPQPTATPLPKPTPTPEPTPTPRPVPTLTRRPEPTPTPRPRPRGITRDAIATRRVFPEIPDELRDETFTSAVRVRVEIGADGRATSALRSSSGNARIDSLALSALRRWRWKPALKDGEPVASTVFFRLKFEVR